MKKLVFPIVLIFLSSCYGRSWEETVSCRYWYRIPVTLKNFDPTDLDSIWVHAQHATSSGAVRRSALYTMDSNRSIKSVRADSMFDWTFQSLESNKPTEYKFMLELYGVPPERVDTEIEVVLPATDRTLRITEIMPNGDAEKTHTVDPYHAAPMCYREAGSYKVQGGTYIQNEGAFFEK